MRTYIFIVAIIASRDRVIANINSSNIHVSKKIINASINIVALIIIRVNLFAKRVIFLKNININNSELEYVLKIDKNNENNSNLFIIIEGKKNNDLNI